MRTARKLRAVPNCPQPESPYKPVVKGCPLKPLGTPIKANPNPGELHALMFAQSAATRNGIVADIRQIIDTAAADAEHRPAGDSSYAARGGESVPRNHSGPCHCGDDAQLHYALIARDLMRHGRDDELTDDMRQAYDYEFGGVAEPEPIQIPEF